ncbi:MAG: hypothetical protein GWN86_06950 [Desulfobacterales bacterium]|nr:hypothetical protein [Desulfobacterales bacterium]
MSFKLVWVCDECGKEKAGNISADMRLSSGVLMEGIVPVIDGFQAIGRLWPDEPSVYCNECATKLETVIDGR